MCACQEPPREPCAAASYSFSTLVEGDLLPLETAATAAVEAPTATTAAAPAAEVAAATAATATTAATAAEAAAEAAAAIPAATTKVATTTTTELAIGLGRRVVQADGATGAGLAVERLQRRLGVLDRVERDVTESLWAPRLPVDGVSASPQRRVCREVKPTDRSADAGS